MQSAFSMQGHRGARGLVPENTLPSFLKALEYGMDTLEMDIAVSADGHIIVTHEPWMSAEICSHPDGRPVLENEATDLRLYEMTLAEIAAYDCGKRGHHRFPEQVPTPAYKPSLSEVFALCEASPHTNIHYNIEIKSTPEWDNHLTPPPHIFMDLLINEISKLGIPKNRVCLQSFDLRPLRILHEVYPGFTLALLVWKEAEVDKQIAELGFQPHIYAPDYQLLTPEIIEHCHKRGLRIIPWTVNESEDMRRLIAWGVDGIITDYPNRLVEIRR
jgi:glycerophosphoryl diester phosphodiesterase